MSGDSLKSDLENPRMKNFLLLSLAVLVHGEFAFGEPHAFQRLTLSEEFHSEGIACADIDGDQINDVISGPFWYRGPDYRKRYRYAPGESLPIKGYSRHFFTWTEDFNDDGYPDILVVGMPGEPAFWFEHPGDDPGSHATWIKRKVHDDISNESPEFVDLDGDGNPELVCLHRGAYGSIKHQLEDGRVKFSFKPITPNLGYGRFTHGMGIGDVDGDGKADLLETHGWWQQQQVGELFKFHPVRFAQSGGAQMYVYDFDGDGDNDVICSQNAHGFGLKWFEHQRNGKEIEFEPRTIMSDQPADNPWGLAVSQMHAAGLVDMDGDGIKDVVTGKRYWAHGGGDPGSEQLPLLFWLRTIRNRDRVIFEPHLIDTRSGVGTQVTVADLNRDGKPDVAVGNKLGTFLFIQDPELPHQPWDARSLLAGTRLFQENVRTTQPLTPEEQRETFTLPQGFEIQLVASDPDIAKPMNIAFDDRGRLWVSSSREYPFAAEEGSQPQDAIKILEDTDGDGRADLIKTFADGLNIPMGLIPYGDGVICFSIPNIWYLRDSDGDDQVDQREVLYGPFDTSNDTHGMCNSFTLGDDGWIYACHGFSNRSEVSGRDGHEITMHSGNVFRFKPDGSRIELVSRGQVNPFGMAIDSRGDIYTADCHTKPINLVLPGGHHDSFGKPHDGLGYIPNVMEHLHNSTGIGGIALGENTNFPAVYQRSTFGGNVVTGRVNRNHLIYQGSSVTAREEPDFLIPSDPWFRPVHLQIGPDGALFIADFYNRIIGHYEVDLNHPGRDRQRGRIWKVVFTGHQGRRDPRGAPPSQVVKNHDGIERLLQFNSANRAQARVLEKQILDSLGDPEVAAEELVLALQNISQASGENARAFVGVANVLRKLGMNDVGAQVVPRLEGSETINCHVFHAIANGEEESSEPAEIQRMLRMGLANSSAFVRRFAALAAAKRFTVDVSTELAQQLNAACTTNDRFLIHALKIALREQCQVNLDRFTQVSSLLDQTSYPAFAEVCMALKTPEAARFITDNLDSLSEQNPQRLTEYLEFAAAHAESTSLDHIVAIAATEFRSDPEFQLEILNSLRAGIERNPRPMPESMKALAAEIADGLMGLASDVWQVKSSGNTVPFAVRTIATAGGNQRLFIDTRARGEALTGVLQSRPFTLTDKFEFSIAGHDSAAVGDHQTNFARLVLVQDGQSLKTIPVPSGDVAKKVSIDTRRHNGKQACFQIWDQCPGTGFAWIAVGEFASFPELNPHPGWHVDPEVDSLHWTYHDNEYATTESGRDNIFVLSTRRKSNDGMQESPLWSSIIHGEQKTGVYRSESFVLDSKFSFYLAGHVGVPEQSGNEANYVQLRLADTGEMIHKTFPPRNDTAYRQEWDTEAWMGQHAFVEIVDQDAANAFAWLAAGRFSVPGLNPEQRHGDRQLASQIISDFMLHRLQDRVTRLLKTTKSQQLKSHLCRALIHLNANLDSSSIFNAAAEVVAVRNTQAASIGGAVESILAFDTDLARTTVSQSSKTMTAQQQSRIADLLSVDQAGAEFLIALLENGTIAVSVLRDKTMVETLRAHQQGAMIPKIDPLVQRIPVIDPELVKTIHRRKEFQRDATVNVSNGQKVYEKNCSNCHQIAGQGKQIGPNLDGIGNRGVDRLVDDVLLPSQNVDVSFRSSLISTVDGRVLSGFVRKAAPDAAQITLIDSQGRTVLIRKEEIEAQKLTTISPMPANFSETISASDFGDLLGYLLSNRK